MLKQFKDIFWIRQLVRRMGFAVPVNFDVCREIDTICGTAIELGWEDGKIIEIPLLSTIRGISRRGKRPVSVILTNISYLKADSELLRWLEQDLFPALVPKAYNDFNKLKSIVQKLGDRNE